MKKEIDSVYIKKPKEDFGPQVHVDGLGPKDQARAYSILKMLKETPEGLSIYRINTMLCLGISGYPITHRIVNTLAKLKNITMEETKKGARKITLCKLGMEGYFSLDYAGPVTDPKLRELYETLLNNKNWIGNLSIPAGVDEWRKEQDYDEMYYQEKLGAAILQDIVETSPERKDLQKSLKYFNDHADLLMIIREERTSDLSLIFGYVKPDTTN